MCPSPASTGQTGGVNIAGPVDTVGGDIVGRDKITNIYEGAPADEIVSRLVAVLDERGYGGFREKTMRDRLANYIHHYSNAEVRLRSEEPRTDLYLILTAVFQQEDGQGCFETLLTDNIPNTTLRGHLIGYSRDLAVLASLRPLFSHVELSRPDLRRCYTASLRDSELAREVDSVEEALHDLLDLGQPSSRSNGWQPICEFVERVARLCKADALHRWVEEHETPVRIAELYAALDRENTSAVEYIVVDVPSPEPDALEFWRYFDRNVKPVHDSLRCPPTAAPLADALAVLADRAADWSTNVRFEIFLPVTMLASDVDQWPCETFEGTSLLGERHAAAIRWRERALTGKRRPQWQAFVSGLEQRRQKHPALGWLEHSSHVRPDLAERVTLGEYGDCLAFPFIPFDSHMRMPHGLLKSALGGGMAYGMWLRRDPGDWQAFRDDLAKVFSAGALDEMPARIKVARREASERDDLRHPFRNLTLFWDDPRRNPWSQGQCTETGQRP